MPGLSYTLFSAAGLFAFRSQTKPTHHRPWLLCLSSLLVAEPSPSFCFSWHSLVKERGCRPSTLRLTVSCDDTDAYRHARYFLLSFTCLLTMTKHLTTAIYGLSSGDHFHCDHNSHVSVFIWGFTMAHTLRVQSIRTQEHVVAVHIVSASRERGRRSLVFGMVSPFHSVQDPSSWCTRIQAGSSCLSYPSLEPSYRHGQSLFSN